MVRACLPVRGVKRWEAGPIRYDKKGSFAAFFIWDCAAGLAGYLRDQRYIFHMHRMRKHINRLNGDEPILLAEQF